MLDALRLIVVLFTALGCGRLFAQPVPNNLSAAAKNTIELEKLLAGNKEIVLAAGEYFFNGPINYPVRIGAARLRGSGGRSYFAPSDQASLRGAVTTFTSANGQPLLRLRGAGAIIEGIEFRGRTFNYLGRTGTRPTALIEVEGRTAIATGRHTIRDCEFMDAEVAIRALAGYYDDAGKFVPDENHADNCSVENALCVSVDTFFRSENQQALNWKFDGLDINIFHDGRPTVAFDIFRGGNLNARHVAFNTLYGTLFKVAHWSPWTCRLTCNEFSLDRPPDGIKGAYLTLFHYEPIDNLDRSYEKWDVRVSGCINCEKNRVDDSKLIRAPSWSRTVVDKSNVTGPR